MKWPEEGRFSYRMCLFLASPISNALVIQLSIWPRSPPCPCDALLRVPAKRTESSPSSFGTTGLCLFVRTM